MQIHLSPQSHVRMNTGVYPRVRQSGARVHPQARRDRDIERGGFTKPIASPSSSRELHQRKPCLDGASAFEVLLWRLDPTWVVKQPAHMVWHVCWLLRLSPKPLNRSQFDLLDTSHREFFAVLNIKRQGGSAMKERRMAHQNVEGLSFSGGGGWRFLR